ncbi:uncharacterized protein LOC111268556 isoform X2 [Varroa jacobsoni]|uniref:Ricin B lectin domain-containing protein n=1 Tax=Varroa destructor TaxID=109461 RepID=A0A7M7KW07_VARDE|nr:uncharacterized protein LOC111254192 isoform X2 [Varroa destructor]XP_022703350.1 uncharacterized protein LOC111268556 isoform X2 [Varroa jacobsoni]
MKLRPWAVFERRRTQKKVSFRFIDFVLDPVKMVSRAAAGTAYFKRTALVVVVVTLAVASPVCYGQYREAIILASNAASVFNELVSEVVKEEVGTFIRTAYKDGCLDAGCCMGFQTQVRHNVDCPSWGWLKWSFNGPMLVSHRPLFHSCMDCQYGEPDCLITTASCKGKHTQFWFMDASKQKKNALGEALFTIVNPMYPDRCITVDTVSSSLHLRPCEEPTETQLFYVSRNWITEVKRLRRDSDRSL